MKTKEYIVNNEYSFLFNEETEEYTSVKNGVEFPSCPEYVFKFYSLNLNNIASVYNNYLWLSNPKTFNDPFDCNLNLLKYETNEIAEMDFKKKRNDIDNVGICCFTEHVDEPHFWAYYTNNYNGFSIKFNSNNINLQLDKTNRNYAFTPVMYFDEFPEVKSSVPWSMHYLLSAKSRKWEYENEWRFITLLDNEEERTCYFNPNSVEAIYIGHKIPDLNMSQYMFLIEFMSEKFKDIPIYVVYPNPRELKLHYEKVWPK